MKLQFEGYAIVEARSAVVNFAGYYTDERGRQHDVLCKVTQGALAALSNLSSANADELLAAYHKERDRIHRLAMIQFSAGLTSPVISVHDVPKEWLGDIRAA